MPKGRNVVLVVVFILVGLLAWELWPVKKSLATVSGSVWLETGTGETHLQRGAFVRLIKGRVTSREMLTAAQGKLDIIKSRAAAASDNSGIGADADAIKSMIAGVKGDVSLLEAFGILNSEKFKRYGDTTLEDFFESSTVKFATADVNGHYEIKDVPDGPYILAARAGGSILSDDVFISKGRSAVVDLHRPSLFYP